jgi:hypothetical protein
MLARSALRELATRAQRHISREFADMDVFAHQGPQSYGMRLRTDEPRGVLRLGGRQDRFAIRAATMFVLPASLVAIAAMPDAIFEDSAWNLRVLKFFTSAKLWFDRAAAAPMPKWPGQT